MKLWTISVLGATAILTVASGDVSRAADRPFGGIVVFGTSLSDPGNAFALRGGTNTPPDYQVDPLLVPSVPYARGGHHFSNGATWVEQFARSRGMAGSVRPAFLESGAATNFAVGGARARDDGHNVNLTAQVDAFLAQVDGVAPADCLYAIEMGGNDIRDAFVAYVSGGGPTAAGAILQAANVAIAESIMRLYQAGARQFLLWRAPNVGLTPAIRALDQASPGAALLAKSLTAGFNAGLDGAVGQLSNLPGASIVRLNAERILDGLVQAPDLFGLSNVTTACITPSAPPYTCQAPDEFLYWDGIHPTRAVHEILAQETASALGR
jgi:phospholipase/lecithinase/hemolysin